MRLLKKIVLGVIGGILAVYLLFAIGLTVLEWIVRENPKVEESLRVLTGGHDWKAGAPGRT